MKYANSLLLCTALLGGGCTLVDYTEAGARVRVATPDQVTNCERIGAASATTLAKVGLPRVEAKVKAELDTLACNQAATLGGDTVVADGPRQGGTQSYVVYKCGSQQ